eukprot:9240888-Pyramimonas_sp.AAC.1
MLPSGNRREAVQVRGAHSLVQDNLIPYVAEHHICDAMVRGVSWCHEPQVKQQHGVVAEPPLGHLERVRVYIQEDIRVEGECSGMARKALSIAEA